MEKFAMTHDGAALLLGLIVAVAVFGIVSAEIEMAWERWKKRSRPGV